MDMKTMKTSLSAIAIIAMTGPAFATDFATLDANADGQVSFDEYKTTAVYEGKTATLAAWEFVRMAQGDAILTEGEFFLADALAGQSYAFQPPPVTVETAPMAFEASEVVETVDTSPDSVEMVEPPFETEEVEDNDLAPVIMEKAMEVDPVVAGEIETSRDMASENEDLDSVTPLEEIENSESNLETQIEPAETEVESDLDIDLETDLDEAEHPADSGEIY